MQIETVDLGFIYDAKKQQHIVNDKMIEHFRDLSIKGRVKIALFTLENLALEDQVINGTIIAQEQIRQECIELPSLIYNLALQSTINKIEKMRTLRKMENVTVINPINRFIQSMLFEMIASLQDSHQFLLPSAKLTDEVLRDYLSKYNTLFLLPDKTFQQPKAVVIKKAENSTYMIFVGTNGQMCREDELINYIKKMINTKKHLLMKGIECLKVEEGPLEARVSVQKNRNGEWSVTAITAKCGMFSREAFYQTKLNSMLNRFFSYKKKDVEQTIMNCSLKICRFLDFYIPFLGSCTLDYIFDNNCCPYLVYIGGFEQNETLYFQLDTEIQYEFINQAFYYLLFLNRGGAYEVDKSSQRG